MTDSVPIDPQPPGMRLRRRAETLLKAPPESPAGAELFDLAHELHVHQIELEMQNDELRRAQEELQISRDRYADLYDFAPVGYLTLDRKGLIREANLTAADLLGVERRVLQGQRFSRYVASSDKDQSAYFLSFRTALESGEPQGCELVLQPLDREHLWARLENAAARDAHGEVDGLRVILTDIGARKRAESHREFLNQALDQTAEAVVVTDRDGTLQYVNAAYERITGFPRERAIGGTRHLFDSGRHGPEFYEELREALREKGVWIGQVVFKTADQKEYDAEESIAAVHDTAGGTAGFISVHRNISEELALRRRLEQAQRLEAIGTLAGGIAHDFNNILMGILGYADMGLERFPEGTEPYKYLRPIAQGGQRAARVVQQILAFSRHASEERRPLQPAPIVDEVLDLLRATLPSTIEIRRDLDPDCGTVLADPGQIHQVVMNLATNAFQAMQANGGVLDVSVGSVEACEPGEDAIRDCVQVTVRDTGPGMEPAVKERIFDPYFTTKPTGQGSGLGLAVVHGIVAGLGGSITVESEPGKGSTFRVCIPRSSADAAVRKELSEAPSAALLRGNERILFVDDEPALASLGRQLLEARGFHVHAITDSQAALAAFTADPTGYDLVFTDQTMPGLTGVELTRAVLAIRPGLPVIVYSGHGDLLDGATAGELGVHAFLLKPVRPARMIETVCQVLDAAAAKNPR